MIRASSQCNACPWTVLCKASLPSSRRLYASSPKLMEDVFQRELHWRLFSDALSLDDPGFPHRLEQRLVKRLLKLAQRQSDAMVSSAHVRHGPLDGDRVRLM
eukprot:5263006-Pleurochrysis_carterae.AAC.1